MFRLLVVDDEKDAREFAGRFFSRRGVRVVIAASAKEALSFIKAETPDLILLDMKLGDGIDGIGVLRELKQANAMIPTVILSATEDQSVLDEAAALGVICFLKKPLELDKLRAVVMEEVHRKTAHS